MRIMLVLLVAGALLAGCQQEETTRDSGKTTDTPAEADQPTEPMREETPLEKLRKDIKEVAARAEKKADEIQVQHLLVAFQGSGVGGVTRSKEEAEQLTAEIWAEIKKGADFDALIKKHTNDSPPGIYGMTMTGDGDRSRMVFPRKGMVAAFGNVGWRLEVGEYGVAPHDPRTSPYGWHIIKRLK